MQQIFTSDRMAAFFRSIGVAKLSNDWSFKMTANTLENHWMPFTANRSFKKQPRLLVRAEGMYYWDHNGKKILDGAAGIHCVNAGHGRPEIRNAIAKMLQDVDYVPHFSVGHPISFELAQKIARITPGDLNYLFFVNSGSEAVDTAMKMALAYHYARGEPQRVRFVGRQRAYHGVNFGGLSVSGMVKNREAFGVGLPGTVHIRHTFCEEQRFSNGQPEMGANFAEDLQRVVETFGAKSIAAVLVEPVAGSTGILVSPRGYLERIREICTENGILMIADEVGTGFGRTGAAFASERIGVVPDLMTMAKAITNGTVPMGAVAASENIYKTITDSAPDGATELFHGYTFSAHPVACAAGVAAMDIYENEQLFDRAMAISGYFLDSLRALRDLPAVIDVRGFGLMAGVELVKGEHVGQRGHAALRDLFDAGLLIRAPGDTLALTPPLTIEKPHVDEMCEKLRGVIKRI